MIRSANKNDMPYFLKAVKELHSKDHNSWSSDLQVDDLYINGLFEHLLKGGIVLIHEKNDQPNGMIVGMISPFLWQPSVNILYQILFHTEDNPRVASNLIKAYIKTADQMIKNKEIYKYTITTSEPMFDINMEKYNFKLVEKLWINK